MTRITNAIQTFQIFMFVLQLEKILHDFSSSPPTNDATKLIIESWGKSGELIFRYLRYMQITNQVMHTRFRDKKIIRIFSAIQI